MEFSSEIVRYYDMTFFGKKDSSQMFDIVNL